MKTLVVIFRILLVALAIVMVMCTSACGGKKKLIEKTEFSTKIAKVERVSELQQNDIQTGLSIKGSTQKLSEKEIENFQAEVDDPSKKATVTKKEKDGETTWELENIKNFNAGKEKSKDQSKDTIDTNLSKHEKSLNTKKSESETDLKASGNQKIIDIEKKGKFPWWWILILLIIYGVISYFRKTLNPLGWFVR